MGLGTLGERLEALGSLGAFLGRTAPRTAERFARLIENRQMRDQYEAAVANAIAYADPSLLIDRWLADPAGRAYAGSVSTALTQLANTDLEAAINYFDSVSEPRMRNMLATGILQSMARSDPRKALEWARDNDNGNNEQLLMQAIMAVAANDPAIALEAAAVYEPAAERDGLISIVVSSTAQSSPELAIAALDQMPRGRQKSQTAQQLVSAWSQVDAKSAMNWALEHRA
jgi:hypothetical protein